MGGVPLSIRLLFTDHKTSLERSGENYSCEDSINALGRFHQDQKLNDCTAWANGPGAKTWQSRS